MSVTSRAEALEEGVPGEGRLDAGGCGEEGGRVRKASKSQICLKTSRLRW